MSKEDLKETADHMIDDQPLEGLLYDLDLLPEQCKSYRTDITRVIIETLHKRVFKIGGEEKK